MKSHGGDIFPFEMEVGSDAQVSSPSEYAAMGMIIRRVSPVIVGTALTIMTEAGLGVTPEAACW
jgi:hypothetical protein